MDCKNCQHEKEAHDMDYDGNLDFTGKCLMKEDHCKCRKFVEHTLLTGVKE